jgi:hypothetical protein
MTRPFDWTWLDANRPFKIPDPWTGSLLSRQGYGKAPVSADRYFTTAPAFVNEVLVAQNKDRITFASHEALDVMDRREPEFFHWSLLYGFPKWYGLAGLRSEGYDRETREALLRDRFDHIACKIHRPLTVAHLCATPEQAAIVRDIEERVAMARILKGIEETRVAMIEEPE